MSTAVLATGMTDLASAWAALHQHGADHLKTGSASGPRADVRLVLLDGPEGSLPDALARSCAELSRSLFPGARVVLARTLFDDTRVRTDRRTAEDAMTRVRGSLSA